MSPYAHEQTPQPSWLHGLTPHERIDVLEDSMAELTALLLSVYRSMPYPEYLQTRHWLTARHAALERADRRCQTCNAGDVVLDVHHRTYERRGAERPTDLVVLCGACHEAFHATRRLAA